MDKTSNYLLRDIPLPLWREVRKRAANDDCTIKLVVVRALLTYLGLDDTDLGRSQAEIQNFERTPSRND